MDTLAFTGAVTGTGIEPTASSNSKIGRLDIALLAHDIFKLDTCSGSGSGSDSGSTNLPYDPTSITNETTQLPSQQTLANVEVLVFEDYDYSVSKPNELIIENNVPRPNELIIENNTIEDNNSGNSEPIRGLDDFADFSNPFESARFSEDSRENMAAHTYEMDGFLIRGDKYYANDDPRFWDPQAPSTEEYFVMPRLQNNIELTDEELDDYGFKN
ncbi:hypothetical protein [Mycobacterium attenuatum]|uniref:hypothetical protein n=1 Tax=Mycobacterium attenuatum TaxID=2341086 RepID=UPI0010A96123|nr:hypothetical protein [Mycobacterium attenuatum]